MITLCILEPEEMSLPFVGHSCEVRHEKLPLLLATERVMRAGEEI